MALIRYTRARNEQNDYRPLKTDPAQKDSRAQSSPPAGPSQKSASMEEPSNKVKNC